MYTCFGCVIGVSSASGELLDHSVDGFISSLGFLALCYICAPTSSHISSHLSMLLLGTQLCGFTAHWVHHVTGVMMLGPVTEFSVDELNILIIPLLYASRATFFGVWLFDGISPLSAVIAYFGWAEQVEQADGDMILVDMESFTSGETTVYIICICMLASVPYVYTISLTHTLSHTYTLTHSVLTFINV